MDPDIHGAEHQAERQRWAGILYERGSLPCASPWCKAPHIPILPGDAWDLGHTTNRRGWRGPEHPGCNRATRTHQAHLRTRPPEPHPGQIGEGP